MISLTLLHAFLFAPGVFAFQGLQPRYVSRSFASLQESDDSSPLPLTEEDFSSPDLGTIRKWTEEAVNSRGGPEGLEALRQLGQVCRQRLPYDFESNQEPKNIKVTRQLIPADVTKQVATIVKQMEAEGLLSTNLDSVDGLPSFHLNLVSNGKPLFEKDTKDDFGLYVRQLLKLVGPFIYDDLLPQAQSVGQSDSMEVADIFLRRYGQDSKDARNGISAHYDVFSKVTSVIAMDNVAAEGTNGLFTTVLANRQTSNHASLRRYFPLEEGDGVLHTWDVLHGVDVLPGSDRTSLIVWFTEKSDSDQSSVSPWLVQDPERVAEDDVTQFVLASALASVKDIAEEGNDAAMHHTQSMISSPPDDSSPSSNALYLQSAARENAFALARVGSICEADEWTSPKLQQEAQAVLDQLGTMETLPIPLQKAEASVSQHMSWQFWFEAAVRGNPSGQFALADDLMAHSFSVVDDEATSAEFRLMATVMFGLAAQQGNEDALERLGRVVEVEMSMQEIKSQEEFKQLAVVQTAQAAMANTNA